MFTGAVRRSATVKRARFKSAHALQQQTTHPAADHPQSPARMPATYHLPHLRTLEAEAVQVTARSAVEFERPVLLFSGGKDSIRQGRVVDQTGPRASRNGLQTVTLLDAISKHGF